MAEKRIQRRLAAILAADVVGYSRLMEQDEAGTLAALRARRAYKNGGTCPVPLLWNLDYIERSGGGLVA